MIKRGDAHRLAVLFFGLTALSVALFLLFKEGAHSGLPGCSGDEACGAVLGSRWARWGPVPLASLGVGAYLTFSVFAGISWFFDSWPLTRKISASALVLLSMTGIGFILWLIFLQWAVIRHFCVFCLSDHALGFAAFVIALYYSPVWSTMKRPVLKHFSPALVILTSIVMVHVFVVPDQMVVQAVTPSEVVPDQLAGGSIQIGKKVESRPVQFLEGNLEIDAYKVPILGLPTAEKVILMLYDYNCPSCRKLEKFLKEIGSRYGAGKVGILCFPVPMEKDCNPDVKLELATFENSCLYAELAMAVCAADRSKFQEYHFWMMEGRWAPSPEEAERKAVELVGAEKLKAAREGTRAPSWITDGLNIYRFIEGESIPKLIVGDKVISISVGSGAKFYKEIEDLLGITPLAGVR